MRNKYIKPYNIWFISTFIFFIIRFLSSFIFNKVSSIGIVILFSNMVIIWLMNKNNILKKSKKEIVLFFFIILLCLVGAYTNSFKFGGFMTIILYLGIMIGIKNLKLEDRLLKKILALMSIFYFMFLVINHEGYNSNTVGQIIYICTIYLIVYLSTKKYFVMTSILSLMISYNAILSSESRGVLLAFILFVILAFVIPKKVFYNKRFYMLLLLCLTVGSILFCAIYVGMWKNGINFEVGNSAKNLYSGRQRIWLELFLLIKENLIFGVGSGYQLTSFSMFNAHNSMLNLLAVYGMPTFLFTVYLIILRVVESYKDVKGIAQHKIAISGFYSFLFLAFFETNLLWEPIAFQGIFLLIIAKYSRLEREGKC